MQRGTTRSTMFLLGGLLALLNLAPAFAYHEGPDQNHGYANIYFERTWEYLDKPVKNHRVNRTWIWGPDAYTSGMIEDYEESPQGRREIQYYDKSRMEITHPEADEKKFPALCRSALLGRHLCRTHAKEFPSSVRSGIAYAKHSASDFQQMAPLRGWIFVWPGVSTKMPRLRRCAAQRQW